MVQQPAQFQQTCNGTAVDIKPTNSDVVLRVPCGVFGDILGTIHTDHSRFAHLVKQDECIVGPVFEFHMDHRKDSSTPSGPFSLEIPLIQMKNKSINVHVEDTQTGRRSTFKTDHRDKKVEISTSHQCRVMISTADSLCCWKTLKILVFSKMVEPEKRGNLPWADIHVYLVSLFTDLREHQQHLQVYSSPLKFNQFFQLIPSN